MSVAKTVKLETVTFYTGPDEAMAGGLDFTVRKRIVSNDVVLLNEPHAVSGLYPDTDLEQVFTSLDVEMARQALPALPKADRNAISAICELVWTREVRQAWAGKLEMDRVEADKAAKARAEQDEEERRQATIAAEAKSASADAQLDALADRVIAKLAAKGGK